MRLPLLVIAAASAALCLTAQPAASAKDAKIEELFKVTKVDQLQDQVVDQMRGILANMFDQPGVPAEVRAYRKELEDEVFVLIKKRINWQDMKPQFLKVYSEVLTDEEVDSLLAFYKTPGGTALLQKMPVLMKRGMEIGQSQMKDVIPEVQQVVEKFMEKHKAK